MKYFSLKTVAKAYVSFQDAMTNKSWGILSILKQLSNTVKPGVTYSVNSSNLSNYLEYMFCVSNTPKIYQDNGNIRYIKFSTQWLKFFQTQGSNTPNVYDVIVWAYRKESFPDNFTHSDLLNKFLNDFNFTLNDVNEIFQTNIKEIEYDSYIYFEKDLLSELGLKGANINSEMGSVAASPGELSRGPFIQPLYAGQDTINYILISKNNFDELYPLKSDLVSLGTNNNAINNLKHLFKEYLTTCVLSKRTSDKDNLFLSSSAVTSYMSFINVDKLFDYDLDKWKHISDIFDITSSTLLKTKVLDILFADNNFVKRDIENNQYFRSNAIKQYYSFLRTIELMNNKTMDLYNSNNKSLSYCLQQIYYGAPGTGKSHEINKIVTEENSIRTTFHPDSDYASFVGCYKPIAKTADGENQEITYDFVPQAFTKAYIAAWKDTSKPYYLVIEEINRGNCAQIFGDIFQLLDRGDDGYSSYEITPDTDLQQHLAKTFKDVSIDDEKIKKGETMRLPGNLHILATMNTSDQSLFPIDSAFKRRWEWKYIPIKNEEDKNHKIVVGKAKYDWWKFMEIVNKRIEDVTDSEDKQIGYWFAKANANNEISSETLVSKVLFYLWNDVFKDYAHSTSGLFQTEKRKYKFREFYDNNGEVNTILLNQFLLELKLENEALQPEEPQSAEE